MSKLHLSLIKILKPLHESESGQLILLVAGAMVVVLGFTALAVDLGFITHTRRGAQNDADAMALAAVRELHDGDTSDAEAVAWNWATKNDVETAEVQDIVFGTTCSGDSVAGTVTVKLRRNQGSFFARVLGIDSTDVNVCATARTAQAQGGPGLMPFGLLYDDPAVPSPPDPPFCFYNDNPDLWEQECTTKVFNPANGEVWAPGNTGLMRLDDPGGYDTLWGSDFCDTSDNNSGVAEVRDNIENGSECGYAPDDVIRTKPGGSGNPTCAEIDEKIGDNTDLVGDVFEDQDNDGVYEIVDVTSPRYALVPVVNVPPGATGSADVTIETFVPVYLVGCVNDEMGTGNPNDDIANVTLIPMPTHLFVAGIDFVQGIDPNYDDSWPLYTIKLVE